MSGEQGRCDLRTPSCGRRVHSCAKGGSRRDRGWKGLTKPSYAKHLTQDRENGGPFMPHWDGLVVTMETKGPRLPL